VKLGEKNPIGFYTVGIVGLFLAGFFLLVILGAGSYRGTVTAQSGNMEQRALLAYVATAVKSHDTAGAVRAEDGAYGQTLVIADGDSGYALRIYRYEGQLVEEFAAETAPLSPADAQAIAPTEVFRIEGPTGGRLAVETDAGRVVVQLRSAEGGA